MKRLVDELEPSLALELLRADETRASEGPSPEARSRALRAGFGALGAAAAVGIAKGKLVATAVAWKAWAAPLLVGVAVAGIVAGASRSWAPEPRPSATGPAQAQTAQAPAAPRSTVAPVVAPVDPPATHDAPSAAPAREVAVVAVAPKVSDRAPSRELAEEVQAIDAARAAFEAHEPDRALGILDEYDRAHPRGALVAEAAILRVDVLVQRGDRARAAQLAREALERQPNGPYRARLRSRLDALDTRDDDSVIQTDAGAHGR